MLKPADRLPTPPAKKKPCGCGGKTAARAGAAVTRPSCLECVEKHLGAAWVLIAEHRDGYAIFDIEEPSIPSHTEYPDFSYYGPYVVRSSPLDTDVVITNLTPGTTYNFMIFATRVGQPGSPPSGIVNATTLVSTLSPPAAPSHLNIRQRLAQVDDEPKYVLDLVWADHADNETGFIVERSEDGTTWSPLGDGGTTTAANDNDYTDETAEPGKQYHYRVKAVAGTLESSYCDPETVTIPLLVADINVDSNNDGTIDEDDDLIEADTDKPGKIIAVNDADVTLDDQPFSRVEIKLPAGVDPNIARLKLTYPDAGLDSEDDGSLRLWRSVPSTSAPTARVAREIDDFGDFIPSDTEFDASALDWDVNRTAAIWVEALTPSEELGDLSVELTVDLDGDGPAEFIESDVVRATAVQVDLDIDSDNDNGFDPPDRSANEEQLETKEGEPGKFIVLNDADMDADGVVDFADFDGIDGKQFIPLVFSFASAFGESSARFRLNYSGSDPSLYDAANPGESGNLVRAGDGTDEDPYTFLVNDGDLRIWKLDADQVRDAAAYIQPGQIYTAEELGLVDGVGTLYLEAVHPSQSLGDQHIHFQIAPEGGGNFMISDTVRVTMVTLDIAADNNRDGFIKFDGSDATTSEKPFLFWLNDNRDVWGGKKYEAAQSMAGGILDLQTPLPGSIWDIDGNSVSNAASFETFRRDLEDFAQIGMNWDKLLMDAGTELRVRLTSNGQGSPTIRMFPWIVSDLTEWSATAHVDDLIAITRLRANTSLLVPGTLPAYLTAGDSHTWALEDLAKAVESNQDEPANYTFHLVFEGVSAGDATLEMEIITDDAVLASTSVSLRLRSIKELYDHFTVAYGPNVSSGGTYRNDVNPLIMAEPVSTTANLVDENLERDRFLEQSGDYFMFVHGWRLQDWERLAFAESAFKRMYWSGYTGQFGAFTWPTQWIDNAIGDAGNFDRSEFIAWNSAAGLRNALQNIRSEKMISNGSLSVMAHSMGNIPLSEALYRHQGSGHLVDTAIMSQAAVSAHYFSARTDLLPSIYRPHSVDPVFNTDDVLEHIDERVLEHANPSWTEYKGFRLYGQNLDVIGGLTPRFRNAGAATGRLINYYNPDDYALGSWKLGQMFKPTSEWSDGLSVANMKNWIDLGNVTLAGGLGDIWRWLDGQDKPGFMGTEYDIEEIDGQYRIVRKYKGDTAGEDVPLTYASNKYEMFAFGASSIVAAVGGVNGMAGLGGVFDVNGSINLNQAFGANSRFNNLNTGHSAQFVHSYLDVMGYWQNLVGDIT